MGSSHASAQSSMILYVCIVYVYYVTYASHAYTKFQSYFYNHLVPVFCPGIHIVCIKIRRSTEDIHEWRALWTFIVVDPIQKVKVVSIFALCHKPNTVSISFAWKNRQFPLTLINGARTNIIHWLKFGATQTQLEYVWNNAEKLNGQA